MSFWEILLIGIALSMDAFAVSICQGLSVPELQLRHILLPAVFYGVFQALMPTLGYYLGSAFVHAIEAYDHWAVFILLLLVGGNMIRESAEDPEDEVKKGGNPFGIGRLIVLAVATSIDALAVGVTFSLEHTHPWPAVGIIGCTTFLISAAGVRIGSIFGTRYNRAAKITGGAVLILIGAKVLVEHLFF